MTTADRFSQIYLARGEPTSDSARFRRRLWARLEPLLGGWEGQAQLGMLIEQDTGATIPKRPPYYYVDDLFLNGETRDLLDAITVSYRYFIPNVHYRGYPPGHAEHPARQWRDFVCLAASEENVVYRPDEFCVMHFYVDEQFAREQTSALAALDHPAMANARSTLERAYRQLDDGHRHEAVWLVFMTAEAVAKEICPACQRLGSGQMLKDHLMPACKALLGGDQTEQKVWDGMLESYSQWIESMHSYRHAQKSTTPVDPSMELTIHIFATGTALTRTLAICRRRQLAQVQI